VSQGPVASYTFTNVQTDHTIHASFTPNANYTILATAGTGGTIVPSGPQSVGCGTNASFTITADDCYAIADVTVDGVSQGPQASYTFTNVQADHTIAASFSELGPYTIHTLSNPGGTITPDNPIVSCGADQAFTITPLSCHTIQDVKVDGVSVGAVGSYTFTNVHANHDLEAVFLDSNSSTITVSAGSGGSIVPSGPVNVPCGDNQSFSIVADPCFVIADVKVDGTSQGAVSSYTFTNVQTSHTIAAAFDLKHFTIEASAGTGGSITPDGSVQVACGKNESFSIAPATCYKIDDVIVDGSSVGAMSGYTFTNVQADHSIHAIFIATGPFTITASAGTGGSIAPAGATIVACDGSQEYTIKPDDCYAIDEVVVDGVSQGPVAGYTFTNVHADHTIEASFSQLGPFSITVSSNSGGSVIGGTLSVACGGDASFDITAAGCHTIGDVLVDGSSVGAVASYTFTNVHGNHTIEAQFELIQYTITTVQGAGGSIYPGGDNQVGCGGSRAYSITPNPGNSIVAVFVDGVSQGNVSGYTFTNVQANHTITATYNNPAGPEVTVIYPNGGETFVTGSTVTLRWLASNGPDPIPFVALYISRDNAATWETVNPAAPNTGSYSWYVTTSGFAHDKPQCLFRVDASSVNTNFSGTGVVPYTATDVSDANFDINDVPTPTIITRLDVVPDDGGLRIQWQLDPQVTLSSLVLERSGNEVGPWLTVDANRTQQGALTVAVDRTVAAGQNYWYRLVGTSNTGEQFVFGPVTARTASSAAQAFSISHVSPNPSRGPFAVDFAVAHAAHLHLGLLDIQGREVAVLADGEYTAGRYRAQWDGIGTQGKVAMGVYFLRYQVAGQHFTQRVVISR